VSGLKGFDSMGFSTRLIEEAAVLKADLNAKNSL